jgi:parallel beta-helix repeat protein
VSGTGSGNLIELNVVTGNTNGIFLSPLSRESLVRQNTVLGNTPIQVGNTHAQTRAVDILNLSAPGQATFERNLCATSVNAPCPDLSGQAGVRPPGP